MLNSFIMATIVVPTVLVFTLFSINSKTCFFVVFIMSWFKMVNRRFLYPNQALCCSCCTVVFEVVRSCFYAGANYPLALSCFEPPHWLSVGCYPLYRRIFECLFSRQYIAYRLC